MFYRRKILLAIIQVFGNELDKIKIQKLLFLYSKHKQNPEYDFVPYKYGCYSFSANADLIALTNKDILSESESTYIKNDNVNYLSQLKKQDKAKVEELYFFYHNMNPNSLMKHTYINYPFWATKSLIAKDILNDDQYKKVLDSKPKNNETTLFTIGYEGISLEEYFLRLIRNDVKVLVDVRRNPLSMKYGFSKSLLIRYCKALDIQYIHFPEVGIQSDQRQELNCQNDYDKLFEHYKTNNLTNTIDIQENILNLLIKYQRIALTCFEANICQCHRKHLAEAISMNPKFIYELKHI